MERTFSRHYPLLFFAFLFSCAVLAATVASPGISVIPAGNVMIVDISHRR